MRLLRQPEIARLTGTKDRAAQMRVLTAAGIKPHPEQRRTRYVQPEEYQAVYAEAGPALRVAMEIAACTGLRRADILAMRWDQVTDDGIHVMTQAEVAERMGCSKQLIGKIERDALKKVREWFRARGFVGGDFFEDLADE